ncbi:protein kinase domain-containing protein [Chitinimonas lacunae]|uniref:Tetratricopeptide repeat protein n=1 Tax=Chitinimonas lacunae TaxID=1963018 RepID=A0ABV8MR54_9NEIS
MTIATVVEPGQHILHYVIGRQLGQGGQGAVFEAWDTRLRRKVALKWLTPDGNGRPLLEEARASSALRHPAVVAVHDVIEQDGIGFIVMDLVDGHTLAELATPPTLAQALRWLREAAEALAEAHEQGVVHGDLKPGNLMIDRRGALRILDFGVSRRLDPLATGAADQDASTGTLAYMAPEQLLGAPASPASDIYALGLVFSELLAGKRLFDDDGLTLAWRKLHSEIDLGTLALPIGLTSLLRDMLHRQPEQRPPGMAAIATRLDQALQLAAPPPAAPVLPPPPATRHWPRPTIKLQRLLRLLLLMPLFGMLALDSGPLLPTPASLQQAEAQLRRYDDPQSHRRTIALLEATLGREPDNAWAAAALAVAYCLRYVSDARDPLWLQRADASAQLALRLEDQLALAHTAQGWVLEAKGRHSDAEHAYDKALALDPQEFHGLNGYSRLLMRLNRYEQARGVLERALRRYPDEPAFLNALGMLHFQQGRPAQAEPLFRQAIRIRPDTALAYSNLSAALLRQNRGDEGLAVLQEGMRHRPDSRLYTNLGVLLYERGRYVEAADAFERALSGNKGSPNYYQRWANLADTLILIPGREKDALAAYRYALDTMSPPPGPTAEPKTLSQAGLYLARLGDYPGATRYTEAALAKAPNNPDVLFRAGLAWEISGRRAQALTALQAALKAGYSREAIASEPALAALRRDLRYHQLLMENPA